jgi:hypothetical protein
MAEKRGESVTARSPDEQRIVESNGPRGAERRSVDASVRRDQNGRTATNVAMTSDNQISRWLGMRRLNMKCVLMMTDFTARSVPTGTTRDRGATKLTNHRIGRKKGGPRPEEESAARAQLLTEKRCQELPGRLVEPSRRGPIASALPQWATVGGGNQLDLVPAATSVTAPL